MFQALAAANAAGIEVTGSALACADWEANLDRVYADFAAEQARKMNRYEDVLARFGKEVAVARPKEHVSNTE